MAKAEWGVKRTCDKCSAKFYDMLKDPAECPACGKVVEAAPAKAKRGKAAEKVASTTNPAEADLEVEVIDDDGDEESDTLLDLDDDDDDPAVVAGAKGAAEDDENGEYPGSPLVDDNSDDDPVDDEDEMEGFEDIDPDEESGSDAEKHED